MLRHCAEYYYAECHVLFIVMLNANLLSFIMLNVVMLIAMGPCLSGLFTTVLPKPIFYNWHISIFTAHDMIPLIK